MKTFIKTVLFLFPRLAKERNSVMGKATGTLCGKFILFCYRNKLTHKASFSHCTFQSMGMEIHPQEGLPERTENLMGLVFNA